MSHWFDGLSKTHRFQITPDGDSSKVAYNSRSHVDDMIEGIKKTGTLQGFTFAQKRDPCRSFFKKLMSTFEAAISPATGVSGNIGVTLSVNMPGMTPDASNGASHASSINTLWSKTDASSLKQLHPETLEPIGIAKQTVLHPDLKGQMSAAHAKSDPETGDIYNYNLDIKGPVSTYRVFHTCASTGKTDIIASFATQPAYLHSLFLTKDHVILCVWNSSFAKGGVSTLYHQNILDGLFFDESRPATWYVIDRCNGKGILATYSSPPFFCFHTVNAWAETSPTDPSKLDIVCELTSYPTMDVLSKFYYDNLMSNSPGSKEYQGAKGDSSRGLLRRFRLPSIPTTPIKDITEAIIEYTAPASSSPELPTMNPKYVAKPHRYTYGISDQGNASLSDSLVKWDSETKTATHWQLFANTPGEPIFVPNPEGTSEDDGVLLSVILDGIKGTSYLLCMDPKTMTELGRADVGGVIGFGFHGVHVRAGANGAIDM